MPVFGSIVQNEVVLRSDTGCGDGIEERRLADVREADDTR